jgi:hypothetical protein
MGISTQACSDESGVVQASPVAPGTYKAFVWARNGVHGHQWVGPHGGVGQFKKAKTITVAEGQSLTIGPVRLDKAGSITGAVTDEVTGQPATGGIVGLSSWDYGYGGQETMFPIDPQGHYTVPNLGPYQWSLLFAANGAAAEWSGNKAYRDQAATIKVKKGETTTYNTQVGPGTTVTGQVIGPDGAVLQAARLEFVNADSADNMGVADYYPPNGPTYTAQVKGKQRVKIAFSASANGSSYGGWIGGTSFADAQVFTIPATGTFTLNVTLPAP